MVDAKVSKTFDPKDHVGSTPSPGTEFRPRFHQRWKFSPFPFFIKSEQDCLIRRIFKLD